MPLWLDLLRTPMAAPETPALRRMRRRWQALCVLLAFGVLLVGPLERLLGRAGVCAVAALLAGTLLQTALYWWRKTRADAAFLEDVGGHG